MDISKLTIQGFKSFYEKSVFTFGKNITAIVGPNGSGKSNITEAIRFVLGEQSTKSMRGKEVSDLLYRGNTAKASKAKVEIEFVKSKTGRAFAERGNLENIFVKNALEKDVVVVSRTIYSDGKSEYMMNGVEIRVKDLHEFLLYIHLGNKSSWHISQGEADLVLQSSPAVRKTIIEDALGLKVYHARINDSLKKLEKTKENIKEATINRKEILPELSMMQKQVEKIHRSEEFRTELENKANIFINYKKQKIEFIKKDKTDFGNVTELQRNLEKIEQEIGELEKTLYTKSSSDVSVLEAELEKEEKVLNLVKSDFSSTEQKARNAENNLQYLKLEEDKDLEELRKIEVELKDISSQGNDIIFSEKNVNLTKTQIEENVENVLKTSSLDEAKNLARDTDLVYKKLLTQGSVVTKDNVKQISYLQSIKTRLQEKLQTISEDKKKYESEQAAAKNKLETEVLKLKISGERIEAIKKQILEFKYEKLETERQIEKMNFERSSLQLKIKESFEIENRIHGLEKELEQDILEFKYALGGHFKVTEVQTTQSEEEFTSLRRSIERLKIRLEESQVQNPEEIIKNFQTLTERDNFLVKEIGDLENSMLNLEKLIEELKQNLKTEFEVGLEHINKVFDSYVNRLFGGGGAKVYSVEIESRKKNILDGEVEEENEDEEIKTGIEVEVNIPKKKVKGLQSLSGGERALVSIALNFSIINQNPAPFMILDETDAALDEANSKRYGEILDMLKQQTKLLVVTHNRETMHFADQVYGVTLAKEGHSKVLSVSFEDAIEYAK